MIKNKLFSSGQVVTLATGQTYTLKDAEVMINGVVYRKSDTETTLQGIGASADANDVKIGIRKRDGRKNLPASSAKYDEWQIDGVTPASLADCIEAINTSIYYEGTGSGGSFVPLTAPSDLRLTPAYMLPSDTQDVVIECKHLTDTSTVSFGAGVTLNSQEVFLNKFGSLAIRANITTGATEQALDVTINNSIETVFANAFNIVNGTLYTPSPSDWDNISGNIDFPEAGSAITSVFASAGSARYTTFFPHNQDFNFKFRFKPSPLGVNAAYRYLGYFKQVSDDAQVGYLRTSGNDQFFYEFSSFFNHAIGSDQSLWEDNLWELKFSGANVQLYKNGGLLNTQAHGLTEEIYFEPAVGYYDLVEIGYIDLSVIQAPEDYNDDYAVNEDLKPIKVANNSGVEQFTVDFTKEEKIQFEGVTFDAPNKRIIVAGGGSSSFTKKVFVDVVNGNDGTGAAEDISKPFQTLDAAFALFSNDTNNHVQFVLLREGTYPFNGQFPIINFEIYSDYEIRLDLTANPNQYLFTGIGLDHVTSLNFPKGEIYNNSGLDNGRFWDNGGYGFMFINVHEIFWNAALTSTLFYAKEIHFEKPIAKLTNYGRILAFGMDKVNNFHVGHWIQESASYAVTQSLDGQLINVDILEINHTSARNLFERSVVSVGHVTGTHPLKFHYQYNDTVWIFRDSVIDNGIYFDQDVSYLTDSLTFTGRIKSTSFNNRFKGGVLNLDNLVIEEITSGDIRCWSESIINIRNSYIKTSGGQLIQRDNLNTNAVEINIFNSTIMQDTPSYIVNDIVAGVTINHGGLKGNFTSINEGTGGATVNNLDPAAPISIRNASDVEQFASSAIQFEGFEFDAPNNRIKALASTAFTAYVDSVNGNDGTAELGNITKAWASLDQAMVDNFGTGESPDEFVRFVILDDATYELTTEFQGLKNFEIFSPYSCTISLDNNVNTYLWYTINSSQQFTCYFNLPFGTISQQRSGGTGCQIRLDDYSMVVNVYSIITDCSSYLFYCQGLFSVNVKKITAAGAGLLWNVTDGDLNIDLLTINDDVYDPLNAAQAGGVVRIKRIAGTGGYNFKANGTSGRISRYVVGDIDCSLPCKFHYVGADTKRLSIHFLNSIITTASGINFGTQTIGHTVISGNIISCPVINTSGSRGGILRLLNFTADFKAGFIGIGADMEMHIENCSLRADTKIATLVNTARANSLTIKNSTIELGTVGALTTGGDGANTIVAKGLHTNASSYADNANVVVDSWDRTSKIITQVSATYTALVSDEIIEATANTFTITLPSAVGIKGREIVIKNSGAGTVTIDGDGAETIDGAATQALAQYDSASLISNGANWIIF